MNEAIQCLGAYVRRSPNPARLAAFYRDRLRLPILRSTADSTTFWAGESAVFQIAPGGVPATKYTQRNQASAYLIFRCYEVEALIARLRSEGVEFLDMGFENPRLGFFLDPDGNVTGLHRRPDSTNRSEDALALEHRRAGEPRLAGVDPMPPDIQSILFATVRGRDLSLLWRFYQDVLGLDYGYGPTASHENEAGPANTGLLKLGETTVLQVSVGVDPRPVPTDPTQVTNSFTLRVHGLDDLVAGLVARGVTLVQASSATDGGRIAYVADPDGHLFGLEERDPNSTRPEDVLARSRWQERSRGSGSAA